MSTAQIIEYIRIIQKAEAEFKGLSAPQNTANDHPNTAAWLYPVLPDRHPAPITSKKSLAPSTLGVHRAEFFPGNKWAALRPDNRRCFIGACCVHQPFQN
jgi:hypothetical protein